MQRRAYMKNAERRRAMQRVSESRRKAKLARTQRRRAKRQERLASQRDVAPFTRVWLDARCLEFGVRKSYVSPAITSNSQRVRRKAVRRMSHARRAKFLSARAKGAA